MVGPIQYIFSFLSEAQHKLTNKLPTCLTTSINNQIQITFVRPFRKESATLNAKRVNEIKTCPLISIPVVRSVVIY